MTDADEVHLRQIVAEIVRAECGAMLSSILSHLSIIEQRIDEIGSDARNSAASADEARRLSAMAELSAEAAWERVRSMARDTEAEDLNGSKGHAE